MSSQSFFLFRSGGRKEKGVRRGSLADGKKRIGGFEGLMLVAYVFAYLYFILSLKILGDILERFLRTTCCDIKGKEWY